MKYGNKKIVIDGEKFDSKGEYLHWCSLREQYERHEISELKRQVRFELIPSQYEWNVVNNKGRIELQKGKCIERPVYYVADFVYFKNGRQIVEDYKGYKTKDYILKRKLMLYFKRIRVKEVRL